MNSAFMPKPRKFNFSEPSKLAIQDFELETLPLEQISVELRKTTKLGSFVGDKVGWRTGVNILVIPSFIAGRPNILPTGHYLLQTEQISGRWPFLAADGL